MKHYYQEQRKMDARSGRKYATTYIKQSPEHRERTQQSIQTIYDKVCAARRTDPTVKEWSEQPISRKHRRREGALKGVPYTRWDCIRDAHEQMCDLGHDMTVSISNRWCLALEGTAQQMVWCLESEYKPNQFGVLYDAE